MHLAAMVDDPRYLEALLEYKADPNTPNTVTGASPLVSALMGGRESQFAALLDARADVNQRDRLGNTALHQAAKINDLPRAERLLRAKANPAIRNQQGATFQDYMRAIDPALLTPDAARARAPIEQLTGPVSNVWPLRVE